MNIWVIFYFYIFLLFLKGAGPSLPSLLQDDPYCHHSGVTVKPRAKSAVSAFSAKTGKFIQLDIPFQSVFLSYILPLN